ncbi:hypothetical protein ICN84_07750 [Akkermansia glycaniphila]|uniref:hypothetical protein n=1 Tax=Akkermansia glycaniphila TaxID=1679444 RepID=UPI001C021F12|nr:hypothetical protein [Akkermansia glycaniphila]MBT9449966.1 hypothetical protein [Akkermansia glycaniphila]
MSTTPAAPASDEETTVITLSLSGFVEGKGIISPKTIDIAHLGKYLQEVSELVRGSNKDRLSVVPVEIEDGSVKLIVYLCSLLASSFLTDMRNIKAGEYDTVSPKRVEILRKWEKRAVKDSISYQIGEGYKGEYRLLTISKHKKLPADVTKNIWLQTEKIIEGTVLNAGGARSSNIHLDTPHDERLIIDVSDEHFHDLRQNIIKQHIKMRVKCETNIITGNSRKYSLIAFIFPKVWDESRFRAICSKATNDWKDIPDAAEWVNKLRGNI